MTSSQNDQPITTDSTTYARDDTTQLRAEAVVNNITTSFAERDSASALDAASRPNGSITWIAGHPYKTENSAIGDASLTADLGIDGLVPHTHVTPRMCGAAGDGATDDAVAVQRSWILASAHRVPCFMEALEYSCSTEITTRSNLFVYAQGAVLYVTAYNPIGGFVHNVIRGDEAARVQSNIRIYDLVTDGSKLPSPTPGANENMNLGPEFSWGASNVRIVNCIARNIDFGYGGGTGGGGFGGEQGLMDVQFIGCTAQDCFRGVRIAAQQGNHPLGAFKGAVGVVFRDFTAVRCGTAVFGHSIGSVGSVPHNLAVFDVVFDGVKVVDCGHMPWTPVDYTNNPAVQPQKTGVFVMAGVHNIRFSNVRVLITTNYTSIPDWKGRVGYPSSGNYVGAGLSGNVGALVWGWGFNTVFEDISLDGPVDVLWKCGRAVAFGELASVPPTSGAVGGAPGNVHLEFRHIRYLRNFGAQYIFDSMSGLNGSLFNAFMKVTSPATFANGLIGPNGTAGLSTLTLEMETFAGAIQTASAGQWLASGNALKAGAQTHFWGGGIDMFGGYSPTGANTGFTYDSSGVVRLSRTANGSLLGFYNGNGTGLAGQIIVSGLTTTYAASSDARLKDDPRDFDGLGILANVSVYDYAWKSGGRGYGSFAQELAEAFPDAVVEGDSDKDWNAKGIEGRIPWSVDYSKLVPILIKAVQQLSAQLVELEKRNPTNAQQD